MKSEKEKLYCSFRSSEPKCRDS